MLLSTVGRSDELSVMEGRKPTQLYFDTDMFRVQKEVVTPFMIKPAESRFQENIFSNGRVEPQMNG